MNAKKISLANNIYLILAGLFITSLVASNLIFTKIFYWYQFDVNLMGVKLFELSVGILPYPLTFLITDLISEIYGQKKADQVVVAGIFASIFSIGENSTKSNPMTSLPVIIFLIKYKLS